jgi:ribosomal protein S18 acetylase RimI-like enzyme
MTSPAFRIVPMKQSHIDGCKAIVAGSEPWRTLHESVNFLLFIHSKQAYVCTRGDEPVGFIVFTPEPVFARGGYIRAVGVAPGMRRSGIGTRLLAFAEHKISRSSPNAYLCVSSFNRLGQIFYKSQGYKMVGKIPGLILPQASEHIYWKKLRRSKNR